MSTAVADLKMATADAKRLMRYAEDRGARSPDDARREVAASVGVGHGTLENLLRQRVKTVAGWVRDRLRAAVIRELQLEIQRLEHELSIARLAAEGALDRDVAAAEAALAQAKKLLTGSATPTPSGAGEGGP